jgi:hypothetical protein
MYRAPNAPRLIGDVLDDGFKLFRECFTQVFLFAAVISLATAPASYVVQYVVANGPWAGLTDGVYLGIALIAIVALVLWSAMIVCIDGVASGHPVSVGEALGIGARRAPAALGSSVLLTLAILAIPCTALSALGAVGVSSWVVLALAAVLLFIVPGGVIAVWLSFGPYAAIIDRLGPLTSLKYSIAITRGNWWRTTALATIIVIILMVVYTVVGIAATVSLITNPEAIAAGQTPWWIQFVVSPLLSAVATPLSCSLYLSIYYDLRLRHEGGDLAARIAAAA